LNDPAMLNADRLNRPRIALAILREGRTLLGSEYRKRPIILCDETRNSRETTIGRLEIISAQHKSCGCSGDINHWSIKDKCGDCTAVNEWAVTALSRKLLRFTCDGDGHIFVQGRGAHASIHVGSKLMKTDDDTWSEKIIVQPGEKIGLAPTQIDGRKPLELLVLLEEHLEDIHPGESRQPIFPNNLLSQENASQESSSAPPDLQSKSSDEEMLKITESSFSPSNAKCAEEGSVSPSRAKRKNDRADAAKQQDRLFQVPLGHDMSSVRRRFLAGKAIKFGMVEVDDIFSSTHILISQQVSTLREISLVLDIQEYDLRSYIEQVCLTERPLPYFGINLTSAFVSQE
jgi:hypothetical protein